MDCEEKIEVENNDETPENPDDEKNLDSVMQEPFNPAEISIISKPDTLHNIIERLKHGEIDMNTDFQRHADLWDTQKMSRLIESILIRFPLPAFYFDASNEEKWLIVDGLQRLSSIRRFVVEKKLKLRGLEYLKEFEELTWDDLPRTHQRRMNECPVTLFLIQPGTPDAVKYSLFRRINTGGLVLTDQEIRNAMAAPPIRGYLEKLAQEDCLKRLVGDQSRRMVDQELVLRFLAFHTMDYGESRKNIATFLDEMMDKLSKASSEELFSLERDFHCAIKRCWDIFGGEAFEKRTLSQKTGRRRKNATLFEVWTTALVRLSDEAMGMLQSRKEMLIQKHLECMTNDHDYFRSISYSTQKKEHFHIRNQRVAAMIKEVLCA
ncbi:DUF262 domain-containing protein [Desulfobotulus mexicanus]|uniref:DUF262 domain-containing protein n=2 Tax=Desulfobotulus mexicanus TaxID=2586642 RepID=A0A5Q4VFA6_9BACT|nr:DUF262 domain-containing protein [Desulfobotulus mexicanus]